MQSNVKIIVDQIETVARNQSTKRPHQRKPGTDS